MTRIPKQWRSNTCSCGSGKPKSAQYDARGIFLTYTCDECHDRKMAGYGPTCSPTLATGPMSRLTRIEPDWSAGQLPGSAELATTIFPRDHDHAGRGVRSLPLHLHTDKSDLLAGKREARTAWQCAEPKVLPDSFTRSLKINARFCQFCSGTRSVWRGHGNALRPSCMHLLSLYRNFGAPQKDNPQPARDNNPRSSRHPSLSKV
jgi:hypothetical protein